MNIAVFASHGGSDLQAIIDGCKNNQILLISLPGFSVFSGFSKHFSESNLLPIFPHTYSERLTGKVETTGIDKLDQS